MFCEIFFRATPGGNYLIAAGKRLIITGGNTPVEELKQIAAGYPVVTALLTHEHRHHAAALMEFCRESGIPLCVPAPCRGILKRRGVLPKETISFDRDPFLIAGLNLRSFPVCHDSAFCCGFFLTGVDGCIGMVPNGKFLADQFIAEWRRCTTLIIKCEYEEEKLASEFSGGARLLQRKLAATCGAQYLWDHLPVLLGERFRRMIVTGAEPRFFPDSPLRYFMEGNELRWDVQERGTPGEWFPLGRTLT